MPRSKLNRVLKCSTRAEVNCRRHRSRGNRLNPQLLTKAGETLYRPQARKTFSTEEKARTTEATE